MLISSGIFISDELFQADSGTTGNSSKENDAKTWLNDIQVNFEEDEEEGKEECSSCPEVEFKAGGISEPEGTPAVEGASGEEKLILAFNVCESPLNSYFLNFT